MSTRCIDRQVTPTKCRSSDGVGYSSLRVIGPETNVSVLDPILRVEEIYERWGPREAKPVMWTPYRGLLRLVFVVSGSYAWIGRHEQGDKEGIVEKGDLLAFHSKSGAMVEEMVGSDIFLNGGSLRAFEFWIREPNREAYLNPLIDTYTKSELEVTKGKGWEATTLVGTFDQKSESMTAVKTPTPCKIIHFVVFGGCTVEYDVPPNWNAMLYLYEGDAEVQSNMSIVSEKTAVLYERDGTRIEFWAKGGDSGAHSKFFLVCGASLSDSFEVDGTILANNQTVMGNVKAEFSDSIRKIEEYKQTLPKRQVSPRPTETSPRRPSGVIPMETPRQVSQGSPQHAIADLNNRLQSLLKLKSQGTPGLEAAIEAVQSQIQAHMNPAKSNISLEDEMGRYIADWKAYSVQWVTYLQKLHEKILSDPSNKPLQEEYKKKHASYCAQLDIYNKKVAQYNKKKNRGASEDSGGRISLTFGGSNIPEYTGTESRSSRRSSGMAAMPYGSHATHRKSVQAELIGNDLVME
eukprot:TRINITY_DN440_c5_g2_i2.p1 TRINITY_DN440_c5_g2~~TRINITY_DN440_c5_g2_i2.p1  ORF type:complete len:519 (+),score=106.04 TRINITY_DN440_c5_g2_i2:41-1597(+)